MSYGDFIYQKEIMKYVQNKLGNNAEFLLNFVPLEKYNELILNCSYVIMNHLRQQAMGNLNLRLMCGASIFLNPQNPAFKFYKDLGIKFFDINELRDSKSFNKFNLTSDEMKKNQEIILNNSNLDKSIQNAKNIFKLQIK